MESLSRNLRVAPSLQTPFHALHPNVTLNLGFLASSATLARQRRKRVSRRSRVNPWQQTAAISRTCCLTWSFYSVVWLSAGFRTCPHWSSRAAVILFEQCDRGIAVEFDHFVKLLCKFDLEDRYSIQMPWTGEDGCSGTLAITSELQNVPTSPLWDSSPEAAVFRQLFRQANCFVSVRPTV